MSLPQRIYDRSPVAAQHAFATISGYQKNLRRYGKHYWQHRRWLAEFDTWDLSHKLDHQAAQLVKFIKYAVTRSEFYRELYEGIDLAAIREPTDLRALPFVDKEDLRTNMQRVFTVPRRGSIEGHTGGTTGKSLTVRMTPQDSMKRMAMLDHFKSRVGFEHRQMRRATFMAKHIVPPHNTASVFWRYNHACRQMLYSSFHLTEENMKHYVQSLNSFKPAAIDGYFSTILDLAHYIERRGLNLGFKPLAIFPTSETVTQSGRATVERVFGARIYDQYASSEGAPFVTECTSGRLHIEHSTGVFETVNTDDNEIAVTSFTTHGTPLIRYLIGDSMELSDTAHCECGIQSTLVRSIGGRKDDYLIRADGAKVNSANVANLFKNMPNSLIRAQAHQKTRGEVTLLLETDPDRYERSHDEILRQEFIHRFGKDTRLTIHHVDEIPRETSGKYRLIKNTMEVSG